MMNNFLTHSVRILVQKVTWFPALIQFEEESNPFSWGTVDNLMHYYPGTVDNLMHYYPDAVDNLMHYYPGTVDSLMHYYPGTVDSLMHYYPGTVDSLMHYYPGTVDNLMHYYPGTVDSLMHYYLGTVDSLMHYYPGTVDSLMLYCLGRLCTVIKGNSKNRPLQFTVYVYFIYYRGCEKSDISKHLLIHEEPKHVCEVCGKAFRHIKNKDLHLKRWEIFVGLLAFLLNKCCEFATLSISDFISLVWLAR